MYSTKENILQLAALLQRSGIDHIVVSPGSRNAPLVHTFAAHPFFRCFPVTDERSAAFFALGMIQKLQRPVAVCCTSGTALLNYASGVAEACYQELPLLVVSADRPPAWIGQMDGQTLPQPGVFGNLVKKSVQLPEIRTPEDRWYAGRLINEALLALEHHGRGPVHINLPLSEPLFDFSAAALPEVRRIRLYTPVLLPPAALDDFRTDWQRSERRLILAGQASFPAETRALLRTLAGRGDCVVLAEPIGNLPFPEIIRCFDALLYTLSDSEKASFAPDLLVTLGGHVVSKRVKQWLRNHPPRSHWHIGANGETADLFQALTCQVEGTPAALLQAVCSESGRTTGTPADPDITGSGKPHASPPPTPFHELWRKRADETLRNIRALVREGIPFSDLSVTQQWLEAIPAGSVVQLANSSPVRNVQLFPPKPDTEVFANRGTSGIDGSMSTAAGYALVHPGPVFLLIGDLSFRYDINCLLNERFPDNLHILLIDNRGGGIFRLLPGLNRSERLEPYICQGTDDALLRTFAGKVCRTARETEEALRDWFPDSGHTELPDGQKEVAEPETDGPAAGSSGHNDGSFRERILHVITADADNAAICREFYRRLKHLSASAGNPEADSGTTPANRSIT